MSNSPLPLVTPPSLAEQISGAALGLPAWFTPVPESEWFDQVAYAALPPNGAANAITVVSQTIPTGYSGIVKQIANVPLYGGFVDGFGWVIWQILIDGRAVRNYEAITAQLGVIANPSETFIEVPGGSTVSWTVQTAVQAPPGGAATICRLSGWYWPVSMVG